MTNLILGTAGHIDHGKTALIKALNGYEGDTSSQEKQRGITIDLSFSNMTKVDKNIAFIDVPGHKSLIKNMIAGAFGFDGLLFVLSAFEGLKPQSIEHIQIAKLLGIKNIILILSKKDLVNEELLKQREKEALELLNAFGFNILFTQAVSIFDKQSIALLKEKLFTLPPSQKKEENFFRYYIDRVFSPKGLGTLVSGTVLGKDIALNEEVFIPQLQKKVRIKNIQVHKKNTDEAKISQRAALNLQGINAKDLKKGFLLTKKGFLRGFKKIDISFTTLEGQSLSHNITYTCFLGSLKLEAKLLIYNKELGNSSNPMNPNNFASLKFNEEVFCIFGEKLILRQNEITLAGAVVLNPVTEPMRKNSKIQMLEALNKNDISNAFELLLKTHKKGLGLISSAQRFGLSHEKANSYARNLKDVFIDEKELIIYPLTSKEIIKNIIKNIYEKNDFALLSISSLKLRIKWTSQDFLSLAFAELVEEGFLKKENNLYKNAKIKEDFLPSLEDTILLRLEKEEFFPSAPYLIYDDFDLDRKIGDEIFKKLCSKNKIKRIQHNIFISQSALAKLTKLMRGIIKDEGYINIQNFKNHLDTSRKYLVAYLDFMDNFPDILKTKENKRIFK